VYRPPRLSPTNLYLRSMNLDVLMKKTSPLSDLSLEVDRYCAPEYFGEFSCCLMLSPFLPRKIKTRGTSQLRISYPSAEFVSESPGKSLGCGDRSERRRVGNFEPDQSWLP